MKSIDNKQFPTVWTELFLDMDKISSLDNEPTLSIKDFPLWIDEYHKMPADASLDEIDALLRQGAVLLDYLPTVKWRVSCMYELHKLKADIWKSRTTTNYTGEKLSEAARERMVVLEDEYQLFQNGIIRLRVMQGWCEDMMRSFRDSIMALYTLLKVRGNEQPPLLR